MKALHSQNVPICYALTQAAAKDVHAAWKRTASVPAILRRRIENESRKMPGTHNLLINIDNAISGDFVIIS
jgi:hypothetical protein